MKIKTENLNNFINLKDTDYDYECVNSKHMPKGAKIPYIINSKTKTYRLVPKIVGEGTYGVVYKYKDKKSNYSIMVKFFTRSGNLCFKTNKMTLNKDHCKRYRNHVIQQRCLTSKVKQNLHAIVMQTMDGDLNSLRIETLSVASKLDLCTQLTKGLICLKKSKKRHYVDIKPGNCLFKKERNKNYYCIGDLETCGNNRTVITYVPPYDSTCTEQTTVWGLALLMLYIFTEKYIYNVHWRNFTTGSDRHNTYNLKYALFTYHDLILNTKHFPYLKLKHRNFLIRCLSSNTKEVPTLKEVLLFLNKYKKINHFHKKKKINALP